MIGENVEGKVLSTEVKEYSGRKYYQFELEPPHVLITATAAGNRLYLFNVTANGKDFNYFHKLYLKNLVTTTSMLKCLFSAGLQWKRHYKDLKKISDSFRVV